MGEPGDGRECVMLSPSEAQPVTIEAPAGKVPTDVVLPSGRSIRPDERGRVTIAAVYAEPLIRSQGWRRVTPGDE